MAEENGIGEEYAEAFLQGELPVLCDQLTAALGKIEVEAAEYRCSNLKATILECASELEAWMMREVDDRGREIVDI